MKKILIIILTIILLIFVYNQYKEYKRFHPTYSNYVQSEKADFNYYDAQTIYNYHEAIELLNGFMAMQWSANEIDVRNPEKDNRETQYVVNEYAKKMAKVKFYEAKLEQSKELKEKGYSNGEIQYLIEHGISEEAHNAQLKAEKFRNMLHDNFPKGTIGLGEKSAFIFEIQKLLVAKGYDIQVDGVYQLITSNAIMDFETKNDLLVDGIIDEITLETLLK